MRRRWGCEYERSGGLGDLESRGTRAVEEDWEAVVEKALAKERRAGLESRARTSSGMAGEAHGAEGAGAGAVGCGGGGMSSSMRMALAGVERGVVLGDETLGSA